ncbi:uncharacterized protein VTP21DRAFT_8444 [Calcarisporiella thermophila]|uniref:uncharacterized protein n=1 Tax=Calcarisporiella thermophila TaxID=911321 RepID=UPI00374339B1
MVENITASAVAAAIAAGMYTDAKLHLSSDMRQVRAFIASKYLVSKASFSGTLNISNRFLERAAATPNKPYIFFEDKAYTYADIDRLSNQVGHMLLSKGVKRGENVAIYIQNKPEYIITWLGISKIGATPAFINYNLNATPLLHCLKTSSARILIIDPEISQNIAQNYSAISGELGIEVLSYGEEELGFCQALTQAVLSQYPMTATPQNLRMGTQAGDSALLIYTSGTTGLPKPAIVQTSRSLYAGMAWSVIFNINSSDRIYCCLPLYHSVAAILCVIQSWISGASVVLSKKFSITRCWEEVVKYDCTIFQYIGEVCRYLLTTPPRPELEKNHHVRVAIGNGMRPDVWEKFRQRFNVPVIGEFFASTEGNISLFNVNSGPMGAGAVGHRGAFMRTVERGLKIIKIDPITEEPVRDKNGLCIAAAYNEPGELIQQIREGDPLYQFHGYYKNPEATKKKILTNVFKKGDKYFRFGDLLKLDEHGYFWFGDRMGDTFRWKSENVSTTEVANIVSGFPGIDEVNVYGVLVPGHDGRCGMAAIRVNKETFDFKGLGAFVKKRLPGYAVPLFLRIVPEMELTGTFKQRKVEYRNEGIDFSKVKDPMYWLRGSEYVPFTPEDYKQIVEAKVRL